MPQERDLGQFLAGVEQRGRGLAQPLGGGGLAGGALRNRLAGVVLGVCHLLGPPVDLEGAAKHDDVGDGRQLPIAGGDDPVGLATGLEAAVRLICSGSAPLAAGARRVVVGRLDRRSQPGVLAIPPHVREVLADRGGQLGRPVLVDVVLVAAGVDVRIGGGDEQQPVRPQHAAKLGERPPAVLDVLDRLEADDDVEALVVERQVLQVALDDRRGRLAEAVLRLPHGGGIDVHAADGGGPGRGEDLDPVADPAARVQHVLAGDHARRPPVAGTMLGVDQRPLALARIETLGMPYGLFHVPLSRFPV